MSTLRAPQSIPEVSPASPDSMVEPEAIQLERQALHEITRLVAERAFAESEVERTRASHDEAADRDYRERRQALEDRFEGMKAAELHEDATRRRGITDASIAGEAAAKDEFARASRKIASEFDAAREQARGDHAKGAGPSDRPNSTRARSTRTASTSAARKPIDDATKLIESQEGAARRPVRGLQALRPPRTPDPPHPRPRVAQDRRPARQGLRPDPEARAQPGPPRRPGDPQVDEGEAASSGSSWSSRSWSPSH